MKSRIILICLMTVGFVCNANGQELNRKIDVESVYKMHLFLNALPLSVDKLIKNDSLYFKYSSNITLDLKKLDSKFFHDNYHFYSLDAENGIHYNSVDIFPYGGHMPFLATEYILCINVQNGRTYRLKGFDGNDFLDFMYDCIENDQAESVRDFLKWNKVEGLDFKFLNKALRARKRPYADRYRHPEVLGRVNDAVSTIVLH